MSNDKTRYICRNHTPASVIFESVKDLDNIKCPVCKLSEFICLYLGTKIPNVREIREKEQHQKGGDDVKGQF